MNDLIFRISEYFLFQKQSARNAFYRSKNFHLRALKDFPNVHFVKSKQEEFVLDVLAARAPLIAKDFSDPVYFKIAKAWLKKFPNDRAFFKMGKKQLEWLRKNGDISVLELLKTESAKNWLKRRRQMNRRSLFELDDLYRPTRASAIDREQQIKNLFRRFPLLTFKDLLKLKTRNLQPIYERFPERELYRDRFLCRLARELKHQKKGLA